MDTNWCLYCDHHFDGTGPFCSFECQNKSGPSFLDRGHISDLLSDDDDSLVYHHVKDTQPHSHWWSSNNFAGISAWAAEIPPHNSKSQSSTARLPKLLRSNKRPAPPALCLTTPQTLFPSSPSRPILAQTQAGFINRTFFDTDSAGKTSVSGISDSSLATPSSAQAVPIRSTKDRPPFGSIATHGHSVSPPIPPCTTHYRRDRPAFSSTTKHNELYNFIP